MALPGGGELQARDPSGGVLPTTQGPTQSRYGHRTPSSGPLACGDLREHNCPHPVSNRPHLLHGQWEPHGVRCTFVLLATQGHSDSGSTLHAA